MKFKKYNYQFIILFFFLIRISYSQNFSEYVNPFIGTNEHGHTFPGACMPFGMVQLSPDTRNDGSWDGCSGYHYSDSLILGFSHTHLSGTGCSDYGDVLIRPFNLTNPEGFDTLLNVPAFKFNHKNEKAEAGYYSVQLDNGIKCELTASKRAGIHQYTFPAASFPAFIIDLKHRDEVLSTYIKITGDKTFEGKRTSKAWANNQVVYFSGEFSEAVDWDIFINDKMVANQCKKGSLFNGRNLKAVARLQDTTQKQILLKIAISQVSTDGATSNLKAEANSNEFDYYIKQAKKEWNNELSKINIKTTDKNKLSVFYTSLYHCMIHPSLASDTDGKYLGRDFKVHQAKDFDYYTVFSLWDTYRALHPLFTLIDKKRTLDFIKTFIAQFEQGGRLPVWELSSNETDCMIGYHSVSVIADAFTKGINEFDKLKALEAMLNSANEDRLGLHALKQNNMITIDDESESVSRTLEYAYDDWCIAQVAKALNQETEYQTYLKRSQAWKNLFDPQTSFFRARKNGTWLEPFDPKQVNNHFTEANSWQYSFYVPQAIPELINKNGSKENFEKKLDDLFHATTKTTGRTQADITGLIGQYAHGNEPSHHIAYLYNYTGNYSKTAHYVDTICNSFYTNKADGLIGNEDCGQMSAWYVFSTLGFYPVCPGANEYALGKPQVDAITLQLHNGKKLEIVKDSKFDATKNYSFSLNKIPLNKLFISHDEIMIGGKLSFSNSLKPINYQLPQATNSNNEMLTTPIINCEQQLFTDSTKIEIKSLEKNGTIYYSMNDSLQFNIYKEPFYVKQNSIIRTYHQKNELKSSIGISSIHKKPNSWKISIINPYNSQYTAGGDIGLIDGLRGETNWKKGNWQGYQPHNMEVIIELDSVKDIQRITAGCLQDTRAWIFFPVKMEILTSSNGFSFKPAAEFELSEEESEDVEIKNIGGEIKRFNKQVKFLKVILENYGKLPEWHPGYGDDAFIFVDEIVIE
jgi:predicted alpha-1,2-mannosidase